MVSYACLEKRVTARIIRTSSGDAMKDLGPIQLLSCRKNKRPSIDPLRHHFRRCIGFCHGHGRRLHKRKGAYVVTINFCVGKPRERVSTVFLL